VKKISLPAILAEYQKKELKEKSKEESKSLRIKSRSIKIGKAGTHEKIKVC